MKNIKMIIILMVAVFLIGVGSGMGLNRVLTNNNNKVAAGQQINNEGLAKQPVKVKRVLKESTNDFHLDNGDIVTELTDKSFAIANDKNNSYEFTPSIMGDWDLKAANKEELNKMVQTYLENTNNLNKTTRKPLKVVKTLTKSTDDVKLNKGDIYKQYNNDSWSIENDLNNTFEFQPVEMGDYSYIFNTQKEFNNCVANYISLQNTGSY